LRKQVWKMKYSRRHFVKGASALAAASSIGGAQLQTSQRVPTDDATSASTSFHGLQPVRAQDVKVVDDIFWSPKLKAWQEVTIRDCFRKFEDDRGGALNNFDKVRDGRKGGHAGPPWYDGLIYEMIRGSADFLIIHPDPELEKQLDGYIARIAAAAAKDPNGYLNTYTQLDEPGHQWGLNGGLQIWQHEVYNAGALIDAGIHYYRATGKTVLLTVGVKYANYMAELMGPSPRKNIVPCHPLPEEVLVKLYVLFREEPELEHKLPVPVHKESYLALAEFWIENRGNNIGKPDWDKDRHAAEQFVREQKYGAGRPSWGSYAQDDKPVFEQDTLHGHAVRATLLCAGIAAAADINKNKNYAETAHRLWDNMVYKRMHITGGVGAYAEEEKFGPDYALPNDAYLETCAAVGAAFFHRNMGVAFGEARYVDQLERALYNGALAGVSLKGDTYFYTNPLECGEERARWIWHDCPCCPPMFLKLMGALPSYIYSTDEDGVYVNLFISSEAKIKLKQGELTLKQASRYPWDGNVKISVITGAPAEFNVMLRIPEWCSGAALKVNGVSLSSPQKIRGFAQIRRTWKAGDVIELALPMPVETIKAHPLVRADSGKAAITRGPIVYCVESADNNQGVRRMSLLATGTFDAHYDANFLGGLTVITANASVVNAPAWRDSLYAPTRSLPPAETMKLTAIPYYANANRGRVDMAVWLPEAI
jgi:DUF1680 family protein